MDHYNHRRCGIKRLLAAGISCSGPHASAGSLVAWHGTDERSGGIAKRDVVKARSTGCKPSSVPVRRRAWLRTGEGHLSRPAVADELCP